MAILYVFTVTNSSNAEDFPPSVLSSSWFDNLINYFNTYSIGGLHRNVAIIFEDQSALTNWINEYKLTDSALINDVNAWKSAHGITYSSNYYALSAANISPTPTPIVS